MDFYNNQNGPTNNNYFHNLQANSDVDSKKKNNFLKVLSK